TFEVGADLRRLGTGYIRSRLQEAERAAAGVAQHRIAELVVLGLDPDLDHRSGSPTPLARARGHRVVDHSSPSAVLCLAFGRATITSEGRDELAGQVRRAVDTRPEVHGPSILPDFGRSRVPRDGGDRQEGP